MSLNLATWRAFFYGLKLNFKGILFPLNLIIVSIIASSYFTFSLHKRVFANYDIYTSNGIVYLILIFGGVVAHTLIFNSFFSSKQGYSCKAFFSSPLQSYMVFFCKYIFFFASLVTSLSIMHIKIGFAWYNNILFTLAMSFFAIVLSFIVLLLLTKIKKISSLILIGFLIAILLPKNSSFYLSRVATLFKFFEQNIILIFTLITAVDILFLFRFMYVFTKIESFKNVIVVSFKPQIVFDVLFKYLKGNRAFIAKDLILVLRKPDYWIMLLVSILVTYYISGEYILFLAFVLFVSYMLSAYTMELFDLEIKHRNLLRYLPVDNVPLLKYKFLVGALVNIFINTSLYTIGWAQRNGVNFLTIVLSTLICMLLQFAAVVFYQLYPKKIHLTVMLLTFFMMVSVVILNVYVLMFQVLILIILYNKGSTNIRGVILS